MVSSSSEEEDESQRYTIYEQRERDALTASRAAVVTARKKMRLRLDIAE